MVGAVEAAIASVVPLEAPAVPREAVSSARREPSGAGQPRQLGQARAGAVPLGRAGSRSVAQGLPPNVEQRDAVMARLAAVREQVAALRAQHAGVVAASEASNADDEHDPEGATIAFERAQVQALLQQAVRTRDALEQALARLDAGTYGTCADCGGAIAPERLEARPDARVCIGCAGRSS
jgi:RNA polymerase-binding transcription factor DksA